MSYHEYLTSRFVENFSQDIDVYFPDGYYSGSTDLGSTFINMSSMMPSMDQPNDYFMRFSITEAVTFNDTISDGQQQTKRLLVFVEADIIWPQEKSKKRLIKEIEPALDSIFLNLKFRGADGSEIYNQQDMPKDVASVKRASGDSKLNEKRIMYPFVVRYL
jgi:hypothetical protein